ncbi:hypothetical protein E2562_010587 [Oryza meyeriana var. granulata]|uniref:Uncharacterized protein n=1 Tax=Oryza meyeriana var. granulata TaxID=110450 RepID=A0A6G1BU12_9ORYZ|nr:hypothetical protein E2562_010587 [Oryza meyeriana var. granulata]
MAPRHKIGQQIFQKVKDVKVTLAPILTIPNPSLLTHSAAAAWTTPTAWPPHHHRLDAAWCIDSARRLDATHRLDAAPPSPGRRPSHHRHRSSICATTAACLRSQGLLHN